jgi:hypothetical protein
MRNSSTSHAGNIFLLSDPSFNAEVNATERQKKAARQQGGVMKKHMTGTVMAVVLVLAVPMFGQYSGRMNVSVPFSFVVENERLQAGNYVIEKIADSRLRIYTKDGRVSRIFLVLPKEGKSTVGEARVIFRRYGNEYFLANIWTPGQNVGGEVLAGKFEQELAKKKTTAVETATLVGR